MTRSCYRWRFCAVLLLAAGCAAPAGHSDAAALDAADAGPTAPPFLGPSGAECDDALCSDGVDNDGNGLADCADAWCRDSVAVSVCQSLENSDSSCSDGLDSVESPPDFSESNTADGVIDCADPDCGKNPYVTVCPALRWEATDDQCSNGNDDDDDGLADCEDPDCLHAALTACELGAIKRVLFDDAHRERADVIDWVVDVPGRHPWPSWPGDETQWAGLISAFGYELLMSGRFVVETLPAGSGRLSYGSAQPQDLQHYQVLVLPEPNSLLTEDEQDAVIAFVEAGGGLLLVTDHYQSDRDFDGADSVTALNALLQRAGDGDLGRNRFGFSIQRVGYTRSGTLDGLTGNVAATIPAAAAGHPVLAGPYGAVRRLSFFRGGLLALNEGATNASVLVHALPLTTAGYTAGSPFVIASELGAGRVVAVADSAILNDGTDSHGSTYAPYAAWRSSTEQNAALFLNAVEWLAP